MPLSFISVVDGRSGHSWTRKCRSTFEVRYITKCRYRSRFLDCGSSVVNRWIRRPSSRNRCRNQCSRGLSPAFRLASTLNLLRTTFEIEIRFSHCCRGLFSGCCLNITSEGVELPKPHLQDPASRWYTKAGEQTSSYAVFFRRCEHGLLTPGIGVHLWARARGMR